MGRRRKVPAEPADVAGAGVGDEDEEGAEDPADACASEPPKPESEPPDPKSKAKRRRKKSPKAMSSEPVSESAAAAVPVRAPKIRAKKLVQAAPSELAPSELDGELDAELGVARAVPAADTDSDEMPLDRFAVMIAGQPKAAEPKATGKSKARARSSRPKGRAKAKAKAAHEPNPWELPPDPGQLRIAQNMTLAEMKDESADNEDEVVGKGAAESSAVSEEASDHDAQSSRSSRSPARSHRSGTGSGSGSQLSPEAAAAAGQHFWHCVQSDDEGKDSQTEAHVDIAVVRGPGPDQVRSRCDLFQFPRRHIERLHKHFGAESIERLNQNMSSMKLMSLYSGLGGAESATSLLRQALTSHVAEHAMPILPAKGSPCTLACDSNTNCKKVLKALPDPPKFLIGKMEDFVKADALPALKHTIGMFRNECSNLVRAATQAKKAGMVMVGARKKLGRLSQKLVAMLIQQIESESMLKAAVMAESSDVVNLRDLASGLLVLVAGSTCRDWSSMGSRKGFLGDSVLAFAILLAIVRSTRPALFLHECTASFKWAIFAKLLPGYDIAQHYTEPLDFGFPVRRHRSYTALVRASTFQLAFPLSEMHRLFISPAVDCRVFLAASRAEAM
ncbi:unnamed protein product [Symbiodinium sp. CCMP2592]|nr:unnamed protein product [Symbiodinium sp. CCMP2592]